VSFSVGEIFHTFEELQDKIARLKETIGVELLKSDSRTIATARKRVVRPVSEALKYYEVCYSCSYSSRMFRKKTANKQTAAV